MKNAFLFTASILGVCLVFTAPAATTHFVDANGINPVPPYTSWATAATNIQDAVTFASGFGDSVLVTNGIYQYGSYSASGNNRVYVPVNETVQSVNGPAVTTIVGCQVPGTTNGSTAIRCVYLSTGSVLSGFTLTNGATQSGGSGGGVLAESGCVVSNCIITGNAAASGGGGGSASFNGALLVNCVLSDNSAFNGGSGGGAWGNLLANCIVSNNFAAQGGGMAGPTFYISSASNCLFTANGSTNSTHGGAAYGCTLNNCTLVGNFSSAFGAAENCTLNNSIIYYNSGNGYADCNQCQLKNCCTTIGLGNSTLPNNSISNAPGFIDFANGNFHLQIGSPCIDAGTNIYAPSENDLDGNPRITGAAVDMGAFESQYTNLPVLHYVSLSGTNPISPYTNWITAATNIQDAVNVALTGEMVIAGAGNYTNGGTVIYGSEANRVALTNAITLLGVNGRQTTAIVGGTQMRCAYIGSNSVLMGFTLANGHAMSSGSLTNEESGGGAWCENGGIVTNCIITGNSAAASFGRGGGVYGGTIFNSVLTNNSAGYGGGGATANFFNCTFLTNISAGGNLGGGIFQSMASNCTFISNWGYSGGAAAYQSTLYDCVLNTNFSSSGSAGAQLCYLYHCTLAGNQGSIGGTSQCTNYNCLLMNNSGGSGGGASGGASYSCMFIGNSAFSGGGAYQANLYNCLIVSNTTSGNGGGAYQGNLYNCTLVGNVATNAGGGSYGSALYNSIIYFNSSPSGANYSGGNLFECCTIPLPPGGSGCFTNAPVFINLAGGDLHQQTNSPTINGGINFFITVPTAITNDFDGNLRIVGRTVDVGAYEYQGSNLGLPIPIPWLRQYNLPTDGSANYSDTDGDGLNNWQEWITGTNPTNASSFLQMISAAPTNNLSGVTVTWQSVSGVNYFVQRGSDLSAQPIFSTIQSNIVGQAGTTSYTDTGTTNSGPYFYRVGVQ